ncbi:MAG: helix-turn-helix transcriptional regulator [Arcobacteraceae bacterium]|nr:helix-turn-helix transcriptional regulator [Arcobacteraceae bacterium]
MMVTFERINQYLKINKISKKEFAKRLIALEPKLKNTGEIPSENTIYAYLNGRIGIKIELIPYIAEVLGVPEQLFFDDSIRTRKIYLKHIINTISSEEKEYLKSNLCNDSDKKQELNRDKFHTIQDLLIYAPEIFLKELEGTLKNYKDLTMKFSKK